jgi:hypothetical protein
VITAHIQGPAAAGQVASNIVADLAPIHFVAFSSPTNGGAILGALDVTDTNQVQQLRDGLWYVNLSTEANPDGEIRGQIILANAAPSIICSEDVVTECGESTRTSITVSDADGDEVTITWMVNGVAMDNVVVPGEVTLAGTNIVIEAQYPLGTNVLEFVATDSAGDEARCSTTVVVEDTTPPVITRISADPSTLWPANHKMVGVNVKAGVEDACGETSWKIVKVTSNEPLNGTGDGNTSQDWTVVDDDTVQLRAERSGNLVGRVYTVWIRAMDEVGNVSEPKGVEVTVPHDQGKNKKSWSIGKWFWSRDR